MAQVIVSVARCMMAIGNNHELGLRVAGTQRRPASYSLWRLSSATHLDRLWLAATEADSVLVTATSGMM